MYTGVYALFSFFISKYCKKHNVTYVISTTCHSEASEITSSHRSGRILVSALSNMFAVILLKKRAKYLLEFLKQVRAKTCSNANFELPLAEINFLRKNVCNCKNLRKIPWCRKNYAENCAKSTQITRKPRLTCQLCSILIMIN